MAVSSVTLREKLKQIRDEIETTVAQNNYAAQRIIHNEEKIKFLEGEKADLEKAIKILENK